MIVALTIIVLTIISILIRIKIIKILGGRK
jgi:hypothetical protein